MLPQTIEKGSIPRIKKDGGAGAAKPTDGGALTMLIKPPALVISGSAESESPNALPSP